MTDIQFYFVVLIDIFYYDAPLARGFIRFLGFLSLTAFQAEGCGGGSAADYKKGRGSAAGCVEGL